MFRHKAVLQRKDLGFFSAFAIPRMKEFVLETIGWFMGYSSTLDMAQNVKSALGPFSLYRRSEN